MMGAMNFQHGALMCGTLVVNNLDQAVEMYTKYLSQEVVEEMALPSELVNSWSAVDLVGAKSYLLQPSGNAHNRKTSYLRLVQSSTVMKPIPHATTYGWCAYEINVKDVFALAEKIRESEFTIIGPPKKMDGIADVIPMQVVGPDQEVLYLNQVLSSTQASDLPVAENEVDQFFIAVLASADRQATCDEYLHLLGLDKSDDHTIRYSLINRAFGLDLETTHSLSVLHKGRMPLLEVDQYPAQAKQRPSTIGTLPLGNAMVSLAVNCLDDLPLTNTIHTSPIQQQSLLYGDSRSIVVRGSSNELVELIECGQA